jgi:hypothetical protein
VGLVAGQRGAGGVRVVRSAKYASSSSRRLNKSVSRK